MSAEPVPMAIVNKRQKGAVLLVLLLVVLMGLATVLVSTLGQYSGSLKRQQHTILLLEEVKESLLGYALVNLRLPCPDSDGDGVENTSNCSVEGTVPWVTLGAGREDAWKRSMRYRVGAIFTLPTAPPIPSPANTTSALTVVDRNGVVLTLSDPNGPAAIFFSCGKDGLPNGENNANGMNNDPTCENPGTPDTTYVQDISDADYDDTLEWLSKTMLQDRMNSAGKWP